MNSHKLPALALGFLFSFTTAFALDSAFTYQGRLTQQAIPASGIFDVRVAMYDVASGGAPINNYSNQFDALPITNGLFTVALDFGPQFYGPDRWLELAVRTNGASTFTVLSPRQKVLATPYAQYAPLSDIARTAMGTSADSVSHSALQQSSVTSDKIADGTITTNDLAPSVGNSFWKLGGNSGTTPSEHFVGTTDNQPLEFRVNNERGLRIEPGSGGAPNIIAGALANTVGNNVAGATISGGTAVGPNRIYASHSTIGGGSANTASNKWGNIGGGFGNTVAGLVGTIAGGQFNEVTGTSAAIGGGYGNLASGTGATASGGGENVASGQFAAVPGGSGNQASGSYSLAAGELCTASGFASVSIGSQNQATAPSAIALGLFSTAQHANSFVWSDGRSGFASSFQRQFLVRAESGFGINTNNPAAHLHVVGSVLFDGATRINSTAIVNGADRWDVNGTEGDLRIGSATHRFKIGVAQGGGGAGDVWMRAHGGTGRLFVKTPGGTTFFSNEGQTSGVTFAPGGGAWTSLSDRNAKENFAAVDTHDVLAKVASLPLSTWNYKSQDKSVRHLGPMAQDFKAAFDIGESDTGITTVDADGVALAAIQALNAKLKEKESRIAKLEQRLAAIETLLRK